MVLIYIFFTSLIIFNLVVLFKYSICKFFFSIALTNFQLKTKKNSYLKIWDVTKIKEKEDEV